MTKIWKLSDLKRGMEAVVTKLEGSGEIRRRLLEMGLVKNAKVRLVRVAPLGDPIIVQLYGFQLSLRKEEAAFVLVEVIPAAAGLRQRKRRRRRGAA